MQQVGTPKQLYEQPANLFVANFPGTANILEDRMCGDGASRVGYRVRAGAAELAVDCPFHAGDTLFDVGTTATVTIATRAVRWLSG